MGQKDIKRRKKENFFTRYHEELQPTESTVFKSIPGTAGADTDGWQKSHGDTAQW